MTSRITLANFRDLGAHKRILLLAIPMILSNITTPLVGMVDTAVLGHMQAVILLQEPQLQHWLLLNCTGFAGLSGCLAQV